VAEVIEGHIRFHVLDPKITPTDEQAQAADDLIQALRAYLKSSRSRSAVYASLITFWAP
jgi:FPC/CPF motif-containing protein YcgG